MAYRNMDSERIDVKKFLEENKVKSGWQNLILRSDNLKQNLEQIIKEIPSAYSYTPEYGKILNAFSHAEPGDIKVVIIGTSPAPGKSIANGLAFSSDRYEKDFFQLAAIPKVHNALREANILQRDEKNYYCGHQEWAENGVLLLNAALTITEEIGNSDDIMNHCNTWREFLQNLLHKWISETRITHKLFVMRWGYALPYSSKYGKVNYAENVWSKAYEHVQKKSNVGTFEVIHHPTFPRAKEDNNFSSKAPKDFEEINKHYNDIFNILHGSDRDIEALTSGMSEVAVSKKS